MESNYGEQQTNINKIQIVQSITLHMTASARPYISNYTLHSDSKIQNILKTAKTLYKLYCARLAYHSNPLISTLNSNSILGNLPRRLKCNWYRDLIYYKPITC